MKQKNRKSVRLKNWSYSDNGYYFVTICSNERECIFGDVVGGEMIVNENGVVLNQIWKSLPNHHNVELDAFQIMPNHFHGIMVINKQLIKQDVGVSFMKPKMTDMKPDDTKTKPGTNEQNRNNNFEIAKSHKHMGLMNQTPTITTLGHIIRYFKAKTSYEIHKSGVNLKIWQRNYHDRIIRNEKELQKIRYYISINPLKWDHDRNNPMNMKYVGL